jgi:hypothetical protein
VGAGSGDHRPPTPRSRRSGIPSEIRDGPDGIIGAIVDDYLRDDCGESRDYQCWKSLR